MGVLATPKHGEGVSPATIQGIAAGTRHGGQAQAASTENGLTANRTDFVEGF
jgi:hypothetical protein